MASERKTAYQTFLDTLAQLEQDQSFYEAELLVNEEIKGIQHEEVIKLGGLMCKRLQKFAEKGQAFAESLPVDFLVKLQDAMSSYQNLIVPPKIFGGLCPCLKPARDGPEYDKKLLTTKAKMVAVCFLSQAVLIESKGEQHNMDSVQYADYVGKMTIVFKSLEEVKPGTTEKSLDTARRKLLVAAEAVDKFVHFFGDYGGKKEFKAEAERRIKAAQEMLNAPRKTTTNADGTTVVLPIGKRVLIKAQSSLQEIMNSAAAISLTQAKENLNNLESLMKLLKKSRDLEVAQFAQMEESMAQNNLLDILSRYREECDLSHAEANAKVKDATKRWTFVKNSSVPRRVAEYDDDSVSSSSSSAMGVGKDFDPKKIFQQAGKELGKAKNVADIFASGFKNAADGAATLFNNIANSNGSEDGGSGHGNSGHGSSSSSGMPSHAPPPPPKPAKKPTTTSTAATTAPAASSNRSNGSSSPTRSTAATASAQAPVPMKKAASSSAVISSTTTSNKSAASGGGGKGSSIISNIPKSNNKFNPLEALLGPDDA